jgi:hypothetical protein
MKDLKEFKIVLEESATGRQLVLPNVKACDYDIAEAYGQSVAADLSVSEVDRQMGYGPTETTWSCYPEEVKPEPEKMRRMEWNTGRHYGPSGQILRAVECKREFYGEMVPSVLIHDITRRLQYEIVNCIFQEDAIIRRYDQGCNDTCPSMVFEKAWAEAEDV